MFLDELEKVLKIDKESSKFGARKIGAFSNLQAPNLVLSL